MSLVNLSAQVSSFVRVIATNADKGRLAGFKSRGAAVWRVSKSLVELAITKRDTSVTARSLTAS